MFEDLLPSETVFISYTQAPDVYYCYKCGMHIKGSVIEYEHCPYCYRSLSQKLYKNCDKNVIENTIKRNGRKMKRL